MWRILGNSSFSQTGLRKRYQEAKQLLLWESVGWTREDVKQLAKKDLQPSAFRIGSRLLISYGKLLMVIKSRKNCCLLF